MKDFSQDKCVTYIGSEECKKAIFTKYKVHGI